MVKRKGYTYNSGFHSVLKLKYLKTVGGILFEDGSSYYNEEIALIKKTNPHLKTIHNAKNIFGGEVVEFKEV